MKNFSGANSCGKSASEQSVGAKRISSLIMHKEPFKNEPSPVIQSRVSKAHSSCQNQGQKYSASEKQEENNGRTSLNQIDTSKKGEGNDLEISMEKAECKLNSSFGCQQQLFSEQNRKKKFTRFSLESNFDSTSGMDNISATAKTNKTERKKKKYKLVKRKIKRTVSMDEIKETSRKIEANSMEPLSDIDEPGVLEEASHCKNVPESIHSDQEEDIKTSEAIGECISPPTKNGPRSECQSLSGALSGKDTPTLGMGTHPETTCSNKQLGKTFRSKMHHAKQEEKPKDEKDDLRNMVLMVLKGEKLRQIPKSLKNDSEIVNAYKDYIKNLLKSSS